MTQFLSETKCNLAVNAMFLRKLVIDTFFVAIHIIMRPIDIGLLKF